MAAAAEAGVPVPTVHDAEGPDLVMDRVEGPTMLDDLAGHPWRYRSHARLLAQLHRLVGAVPALPGLPQPVGPGADLLHLDLHPGNVILAPTGPVVIDWANAAVGPAAADVADTWLLLVAGEVEGGVVLQTLARLIQQRFAAAFIDAAGRAPAARQLPAVLTHRLGDRNMRPGERARMEALTAREAHRRA